MVERGTSAKRSGIVADDVTMTFDDVDVVDRTRTSRSNPARSSG